MTTTPTTATGEGEQIPLKTRSKYIIEDSIINHELRRKLWDGMLPLKIEMSIDDLFSPKMPIALYVSIPQRNINIDYGSERELLLLFT